MPPRIPSVCPPNFRSRYIVRPGDTMFTIAQFFRVRLSDLIRANPHITNPNAIFPGDVLCVPGLISIPCCVLLQPRVVLPVGTDAVAFVHTPPTGGEAVTVAATLPHPSTFGDFDTYIATVIIPEIDGGPGNVLFPTSEDPPTYAVTIPIPTAARLTPNTRVIIEPYKNGTGVSGPVLLEARLGNCR